MNKRTEKIPSDKVCVQKKNLILADCETKELEDFKKAIEKETGEPFEYAFFICNKHNGLNNVKRLLAYIFYPLAFVVRRKNLNCIIGWQQMFAIFYCFWCRLFHLKKCNRVIAMNFTYKDKRGIAGSLYKQVIKYAVTSDHLDYMHVPSNNYVSYCCEALGLTRDKFIVAPFGIIDQYELYRNASVEYDNFSFSIGRSNRDFDWLVSAWDEGGGILLIASDSWRPKSMLPDNVIHRYDISGKDQFKYFACAQRIIIPIDNEKVCSGDTVLLTAMSFEKAVYITAPSTLAEMYIENGIDGITVEKGLDTISEKISQYKAKEDLIGKNARDKYLDNYTRYALGREIGLILRQIL